MGLFASRIVNGAAGAAVVPGFDLKRKKDTSKTRSESERFEVGSLDRRIWQTELSWNAKRQSPSRCLSCGSSFAITLLQSGEIPKPNSDGTIVVKSDGMLGGGPYIPPPTNFDHERLRIASSNAEHAS